MMATKPQTDPTITPMLLPPFDPSAGSEDDGVAEGNVVEELWSVAEGVDEASEVGFSEGVDEWVGLAELATEELGLGAVLDGEGGGGAEEWEGAAELDGVEGIADDGLCEALGSGAVEDGQVLNTSHKNCALISCTNTREINKTIKMDRVLFKRIAV